MATAEKFKIFEAEIDVNKAIENTRALKATLQNLKEEAAKVKAEQGELSSEYIEYQAAIKSVSGELRKAEAVNKAVIDSQYAQAGSLNQLKAQLAIVTAEWNELSEEERLNTEAGKALTASKKQLTEQLTKEEKATGDARRQVGFYERGLQQTTEATTQFIPAAGKAQAAAKSLGVAFKLMLGPIGIIIAVVATVVKAFQTFFTSTEEGQNKLRMLQAVFGAVFDTVNVILTNFAKAIIWVFTEPKKAIKQLWANIKENIINRFDGLIKQFTSLGKILQGVFTLDWDKIKEGGKDYANATIQVLTGVEDALDKLSNAFTEFADEQAKKIAEAQRISQLQDALDEKERKNLVKNAELQRDVAKLKEEAMKKDMLTASERLALLDEALRKETEMENNAVDIARRRLEIRQAQNALTLSTKEDLEEEAKLTAELIKVEADAANKRKEIQGQRSELLAKIAAEEKARAQVAITQLEKELELYQLTNKTKVDGSKKLTKDLVTEEVKRLGEIEAKQQEALKRSFYAGLTAQIDYDIERLKLQDEYNSSVKALNDSYAAQEKERKDKEKALEAERLKANYDNELMLAENDLFKKIELQKQFLAQQQAIEIEAANKSGADKFLIEQKYAALSEQLEQQKTDARLAIASTFAGQLATLFGEQTALGKAAAVTQTAINTYQGAMAAFAQTPGGIVIKSAAAALATAVGIKQIRNILKTKTDIKSGSASAGIASTPTAPTASAPTAVTPILGSSIAGQGVGTSAGQMTSRAVKDLSKTREVLVVDDVTAKQQVASRNRRIGSI